MDEVATIFSFNNWPDHFSYLLIAISYWLTDIFWLRLVALSVCRSRSSISGTPAAICAPALAGT